VEVDRFRVVTFRRALSLLRLLKNNAAGRVKAEVSEKFDFGQVGVSAEFLKYLLIDKRGFIRILQAKLTHRSGFVLRMFQLWELALTTQRISEYNYYVILTSQSYGWFLQQKTIFGMESGIRTLLYG